MVSFTAAEMIAPASTRNENGLFQKKFLLVPMSNKYRKASHEIQLQTREKLQYHANSKGLSGTVVTVWKERNGNLSFLAPASWNKYFYDFFKDKSFEIIRKNTNTGFRCPDTGASGVNLIFSLDGRKANRTKISSLFAWIKNHLDIRTYSAPRGKGEKIRRF